MRCFHDSALENKRSNHAHPSTGARRPLGIAAGLTGFIFIVELVGGYYSGSLALLSDAGHVFMDLTALGFALTAMILADRPVSDRRTFGLHRVEVLAALANGLLIAGLAVWILWESAGRFSSSSIPRVGPMAVLGGVGLIINLVVAWLLHGFSKSDLNTRAAFLHVVSDALASVGVIAGAGLISVTGWTFVDPLVGMGIAVAILVNAGRLLREALNLLLEGVPHHLDLAEVEKSLLSVDGVHAVNDLHLWGLCSHLTSLSAHVRVNVTHLAQPAPLLNTINTLLKEKHAITHTTIQLESV
jgi:cobalt-zinc-cadmium efflux system protein